MNVSYLSVISFFKLRQVSVMKRITIERTLFKTSKLKPCYFPIMQLYVTKSPYVSFLDFYSFFWEVCTNCERWKVWLQQWFHSKEELLIFQASRRFVSDFIHLQADLWVKCFNRQLSVLDFFLENIKRQHHGTPTFTQRLIKKFFFVLLQAYQAFVVFMVIAFDDINCFD